MRATTGTQFHAHHGRWWQLGALSADYTPRWWRFGLGFGGWYAALYVGPLAVAVGSRTAVEAEEKWRVSSVRYEIVPRNETERQA